MITSLVDVNHGMLWAQGSHGSWKSRKVMECLHQFPGMESQGILLKVLEFENGVLFR